MPTKTNMIRRRGILLSLVLAPFVSKAEQQQKKEISTPSGIFSLTSQEVAPVPQQVVRVDAQKLKQIRELDFLSAQFVTAYRPGASRSLKSYDEAFRAWQLDKARQFSEDAVTERLGAHLGNKLAADFDMEWVVVTDEFGTDLAVQSRKYEVISFPFSSVAKRIQDNHYDFMEGVYFAVKDVIASEPKKR
jgi:hypothetical protein